MRVVITYGTYDLFHKGHYNLLKRAKKLGDFLIVGVTSESFDRERGKLNVHDDLMTRIENVKSTGLADKIIVEEYFGQKIRDIKKYHVDIFTVGSDWTGHFDYLKEYCSVIYLKRTEGVSSTKIRNKDRIRIGIVGNEKILDRFLNELRYVSGIEPLGIYSENIERKDSYFAKKTNGLTVYKTYDQLLDHCEAVYINAPLKNHFTLVKKALGHGKHVLVEFPFCMNYDQAKYLVNYSEQKKLVLQEGLKTAYCPAFSRLISIVKSGKIGKVLSIEANFTQILGDELKNQIRIAGGSVNSLGAYPLLIIFKLFGFDYNSVDFITHDENGIDLMTRMNFVYDHAMASSLLAVNAKAEGDLILAGTEGYIYVPAPWWKTEYFEIRYEDVNKNQRFFYKFEGEGLRYEIADFVHSIRENIFDNFALSHRHMIEESRILSLFQSGINTRRF